MVLWSVTAMTDKPRFKASLTIDLGASIDSKEYLECICNSASKNN
jgi:hypothetical protein